MKDTIEKNKLIAEFMGYYCELPEEDSCTFETPYMVNISDKEDWEADVNDYTSCLRADEMLFHTSWDWLMPVIYSIYNISVDDITNNKMGDITHALLDVNIEDTYKEVVEFIKWYNKEGVTNE